MFGQHVPVHLHLFDVPAAENALLALRMELEDSAFPQLQGQMFDLFVCVNERIAVRFDGKYRRVGSLSGR